MTIALRRTFGEYKESPLKEGEEDWLEYFGSKRGRLTWSDLHKRRVVVVLGEAGIGKTVELQLETERLTASKRSAFFLPLNILRTKEDWQLALGEKQEAFATWTASTGECVFFLDAVDEARLNSHADFTRALGIIRGALAPFMARVRIVVSSRVPEKHLQLWLAAKYQDTQNLRFSIHREEEVDDDKRTDIQLACATAKVCVEIKPLDESRRYTASSLVEDTLKRQLVGQYLKGRNSSRGILVLMQLDDKRWDLPDAKGQSFDELVGYLQNEAEQIKLNSTGIAELHVFGIRCIN